MVVIFRKIIHRLIFTKDIVYLTIYKISDSNGFDEGRLLLIHDIGKFKQLFVDHIQQQYRNVNRYLYEVEGRFQAGHICAVFINNDGIASSFLFVGFKSVYLNPVHKKLLLPANEVAIYDVFTVSKFRGQGLYPRLFHLAVHYLAKQGISAIWLWLMPHNLVSIKTHIKLGFKRIVRKYITYQVLGIRITRSFDCINDLSSLLR